LTEADMYVVPFNGGAGGNATPVNGASVAHVGEYYPSFSGDEAYIAYNRIDNMAGSPFTTDPTQRLSSFLR